MNKFYFDSRQHAAKKMTAAGVPCAWVRVLQRQDEHEILDCGRGRHTVKEMTETSGQLAFSAQKLVTKDPGDWPEAFVVEVEPEVGTPFRVLGCQVGARYDGYGEDSVIFDFVAEKLDLEGQLSLVMSKDGVVGQVTSFEPTEKLSHPVYELRPKAASEYVPGRGHDLRGLDEAHECAIDAATTALDRRFRAWADDSERLDTDAMFCVVRVDLSSVYGDTDLKITTHGPWDNEPQAQRAASRLRGRTFVLGPVAVAQYRRRT